MSVFDAAEVAGFGFRQYPTIDRLLDACGPSTVGCLVISCGEDTARNRADIEHLKSHLLSMSIIVLLDSGSTVCAVELMQQGVFSVLTQPYEHHKLVSTISAAVDMSVSHQTSVDGCREASLRMSEATDKELEVLSLIMEGRKNKEIARLLGITVRAVEDRRFRLMKKVSVDSVAELVALAITAKFHEQGITTVSVRSPLVSNTSQSVKGIEVWVPSRDDLQLELADSCYRDATAFQEASRGLTFRRGEGLPGSIWERRAPAFLKELISGGFVRSSAAGASGMTTAVGFPVFCDGRVQSVVLILLDGRQQMKAAFESWRFEPQSSALRLVSGTYVNCEKLRRLSEFMHLPIGEGLAGVAAEQGRPYAGARFAEDANAVRGIALSAEQLVSGVALPLTDSGAVTSDVFLMFNSETTPMFSLLQVWKPAADGSGLCLASEYVDGVPSLASQISSIRQPTSDGIAGESWKKCSPVVVDNGHASQAIIRTVHATTPSFGIAIPTIVAGKVVAVTVLAN
jgi:FixJ family two-component response regulator